MNTVFRFELVSVVFETESFYSSGGGVKYPVYNNQIFDRSSKAPSATSQDYQVLDEAMSILTSNMEADPYGGYGYFVDGEPWILLLNNIEGYRFKKEFPKIIHLGNPFNPGLEDIFTLLKEGKKVSKRGISPGERSKFLSEYAYSDDELWEDLLKRNAHIEWAPCPEGEEVDWVNQNNPAPSITWRKHGVDSVLDWKKWTLLPRGRNGEMRILEMHKGWSNSIVQIIVKEEEEEYWKQEFLFHYCPAGGNEVVFGFFAARADVFGSNGRSGPSHGRVVY